MTDDNPFVRLGLQKDVVESLHKQGRLEEFLRTYYRSIQVHIHPDRGGDSKLAAAINAAYDDIQRQPNNIEAWMRSMSNGNDSNPEYLALIEGLTAKVEELQGMETEYRKLQERYAKLLTSRNGDGTKAKVRTASPRARREDVFTGDIDAGSSDHFDGAPEVRRPRARRVDTAGETTPRKRAAPKAEPIVLPDIVLYDAEGKPARKYAKVTLDGALIGDAADKPITKTQDDWISYYKMAGGELLSLPLFYAIIEKVHTEKHPAGAAIREDLQKHWIATSTRIDYKKNIITHGFGFSSVETYSCPIPAKEHWLDKVKDKKAWRSALQALFMPKDVDQAIEVLHKFSGVRPYIWTETDRKEKPIRAAFVGADPGGLDLICYDYLVGAGCSRRVALK